MIDINLEKLHHIFKCLWKHLLKPNLSHGNPLWPRSYKCCMILHPIFLFIVVLGSYGSITWSNISAQAIHLCWTYRRTGPTLVHSLTDDSMQGPLIPIHHNSQTGHLFSAVKALFSEVKLRSLYSTNTSLTCWSFESSRYILSRTVDGLV